MISVHNEIGTKEARSGNAKNLQGLSEIATSEKRNLYPIIWLEVCPTIKSTIILLKSNNYTLPNSVR